MEKLAPEVQNYSWGSATALPELLGVEPDGKPWAELWVGDHPRLASSVVSTGQKLDVGLPFMLKILAADQPLSIQSHPSLEQARSGYRRENDAGVPIDAANRTYRDANHKPELICAVTQFEALCGFRQPELILADIASVPALSELTAILSEASSPQAGLEAAVRFLLELESDAAAAMVGTVSESFELTRRLAEIHPGDPGAIVALLLNHLVLAPGQAVFLGAGNLHAYLQGVGVELMANSDNVVRGGLTEKHIDVNELMAVVDFSPLEPFVQTAVGPVHRFEAPVVDFSLVRSEIYESSVIDIAEPELIMVTEGSVRLLSSSGGSVDSGRQEVMLNQGEAAYLVPSDGSLTVDGSGVAWRATSGQ